MKTCSRRMRSARIHVASVVGFTRMRPDVVVNLAVAIQPHPDHQGKETIGDQSPPRLVAGRDREDGDVGRHRPSHVVPVQPLQVEIVGRQHRGRDVEQSLDAGTHQARDVTQTVEGQEERDDQGTAERGILRVRHEPIDQEPPGPVEEPRQHEKKAHLREALLSLRLNQCLNHESSDLLSGPAEVKEKSLYRSRLA